MPLSLQQAVDDFFVARMPRQHSPHTLAAYRRDLESVSAHLVSILGIKYEQIHIDHLTLKVLRAAFATASDQSASTVARTWSTWNQLFTFLVSEQLLAGNPMAGVERPKVPRSRPKAIVGDDSIERLLRVAANGRKARDPWPERDFALIVTLITCGLRLGELVGLTISSIDGPPGERVVALKGKGNKERTVPIEPEVEHIIASYIETRQKRFGQQLRPSDPLFVNGKNLPLERGAIQYMVDQLYRQAGIRSRVPAGALVHALRHTFATSLARNGATGTELQRLLGHESLSTTQHYIDATARELRAAARSNEAYRAIATVANDNLAVIEHTDHNP